MASSSSASSSSGSLRRPYDGNEDWMLPGVLQKQSDAHAAVLPRISLNVLLKISSRIWQRQAISIDGYSCYVTRFK
ncbi:hypothetical protein EJB05_20655 [Eragrostis curvula]|uniref:Uncharacterized protein n=1 Tax=Eragrostis curvula TaxID=38414 RepID=A0A5J9UZM4_9POAL|nr:hypothetical protein EJB05_20655 [Eragrostis curvula]